MNKRTAVYNVNYIPDTPDKTGWKSQHANALPIHPVGCMLRHWIHYAVDYRIRYDSLVREDGVLGPAWIEIGRSLRTLLNGELGGLDAGTLDTIICATLRAEGVDDV